MRALLAIVTASLLVGLPDVAAACSVCTTGTNDGSAGPYLFMTIFMTTLPFAAVGGLILFLRSRFKALEAAREPAPIDAGGAVTPVRSR